MSEKNLLWLIAAKPEAGQFWILDDQPIYEKQNPIPSKIQAQILNLALL